MKHLLILVTATLAFTFTALARGNTSSGTGQADSSETKGTTDGKDSAKLTGCLATSEKGGGFILTNGKQRVEVESAQNLGAYTGHQVNLEGTWEKSDTGKEGGTKGLAASKEGGTKGHAAGKEGGTKGRVFNATKIKEISDTCSTDRH